MIPVKVLPVADDLEIQDAAVFFKLERCVPEKQARTKDGPTFRDSLRAGLA